jgi:hypothetical protein
MALCVNVFNVDLLCVSNDTGRSRAGEDGGRRELDGDAGRRPTTARRVNDPKGRWPKEAAARKASTTRGSGGGGL